MALIPSESYSFPEHFVQTVSRARKAVRQPIAPPPDPAPQPEPINTSEAAEAEVQPEPSRRWWRIAGLRLGESEKIEPPVAEEPEQVPHEPAAQTPFAEPVPNVNHVFAETPAWPVTDEIFAPAAADMPAGLTYDMNAEAVMEETPVPPVFESGPDVFFPDPPVEVQVESVSVNPPLEFIEDPQPIPTGAIEQTSEPANFRQPQPIEEQSVQSVTPAAVGDFAAVELPAPVNVPEPIENGSDQPPTPRVFIPSLVPSTLKRKVRWNVRAAQAEDVPRPNESVVDFNANSGPAIDTYPDVPPFPQPVAKAKPDIRPKISLVAPPAEPEQQFVAEPAPQNIIVPEEPGSRIVEAPSADLVQTLLARALFGSSEAMETEPPAQAAVPAQHHIISFAPASPAATNGHVAPAVREVESIVPPVNFAVARPINERVLPEKRRRANPKLRRFIMLEAIALVALVPLAALGLLRVFRDPTLILIVDVITIAAAIAATVMPILFFAVAPPLPRGEE